MHTIHHRRGHKRYPDTAVNEISTGPRRSPPAAQWFPGPKSEAKMLSGLPRLTPSTSTKPFTCSDTLSGHSRQRFDTMLCYAPRGTGKGRVWYSNLEKGQVKQTIQAMFQLPVIYCSGVLHARSHDWQHSSSKSDYFCQPSRRPLARTGHRYLRSQSQNTCKGSLRMGCNNDRRGFGDWLLYEKPEQKRNIFLKAKQAMLSFPFFLKSVFLSNCLSATSFTAL